MAWLKTTTAEHLDETVTHNGTYIAIGSTGNTWLHESCPGDGTVHIRVVSKSNHTLLKMGGFITPT